MDVFRAFNNINFIFAWQIICNLLELNILQQDENLWVVLGLGTKVGLARIFDHVTSSKELEYS